MGDKEHRNIVIIGGGIIGCTTAYYLTRHPSYSPTTTSITHGVAQGASGKAGGLVAKWAYPRELVDISFEEHIELAKEHNGKERWGWRFVACGSWEGRGEDLSRETGSGVGKGGKRKSLEKKLELDPEPGSQSNSFQDDLNFVKEHLTDAYSPMPPDETAQVHPYLFTTSMMDLAAEEGATLLRGSATSIEREGGQVTGVRYKDPTDNTSKVLPATHVILSSGAWSSSIIPALPISATRAHSITVRPRPDVTIAPYVLFTEIALPRGKIVTIVTPEIYARPDNEIYACGPGDDSKLPGDVDDVEVDQTATVASISPEFREGTIEKRQACFLPTVSGRLGGPIIGEARKIAKGIYIATGHTCWGICNAPGTAKVLTELVMDGKIRSGNIKKLAPSHFL
ncbi:FAD dependent oxidoreductase [Melanogaster broomeanus]|nr:FAD dependent oxidoreductase [Melanogaster broomeanus]